MSNRKLKINFVWDWQPNYWQSYTWTDGLAAALVELQKRGHEIRAYADTDQPVPNPMIPIRPLSELDTDWCDVFLHWADMTRPNLMKHFETGKPVAICFAGGEVLTRQTKYFSHIFVESQVYYDRYESAGFPVSIAFGTNTDLYKPVQQAKVFDALFPATFAAWKRHELFAGATKGLAACAVGFMYDDHEQECWQVCVDAGNLVLPHVSAEVLHRLYASSKTVVIPSLSSGGSQRTVLEALAMNIHCIVTDSDKFDYEGTIRVEPTAIELRRAIEEYKDTEANTREYILDTWSHIQYANNIEKGLRSIV